MAVTTCLEGHPLLPHQTMCPVCGRAPGPLEPANPTPVPSPVLGLELAHGSRIEVTEAEGQVLLGRALESPHARLFAADEHVSRCHAVVWIEPDGRAWIQDQGSLNHTLHNGSDLFPDRKVALANGDTLRFGPSLTITVRIDRAAQGDPGGATLVR